jgi:hypothetical protein
MPASRINGVLWIASINGLIVHHPTISACLLAFFFLLYLFLTPTTSFVETRLIKKNIQPFMVSASTTAQE